MITHDFLPFAALIPEIAPHTTRHYLEMTDGDNYGAPDVDWDYYVDASLAKACYAVATRDNGELVGYSIYTLGTNPRYKDRLEASCDGIFIEKPYRGKISNEMLAKADTCLAMMGVRETSYTMSDPRMGKLLERKDFKSKYKVWSKTYGQ